ncbi:MAG: AraC family transcriptional regulator of adaptative response / DNA-3-methyladenine glycosylase II [Bacteroidia bacterium]|jgi:AraC family transcriptional regulator of adaptative response / DNA-3-methyladenine glycosylase II
MTNAQPTFATTAELDPDTCRRARLSRDPRFDGEFYIAVTTTGIYCRPICPARPPAEKHVRYFKNAVGAAQSGFRPCLRCRPESAPGSPAWQGSSTTLQRALSLIGEGALNEGSLPQLAARLGIGERYLRKLFEQELGVSPQAVALNQRLLFAKKLLAETALPLAEVAYASGFGSVRRFNSAVREQFRLTPGDMRRQQRTTSPGAGIQLQLQYRPPYNWELVADFFSRHAIAGLEEATDKRYRRHLVINGKPGSVTVSPLARGNALHLELDVPDHSQLITLVARIRRMFDLDANPDAINQALGRDPRLKPLLKKYPGMRAPSHWSLFESCVRGVVGQQVSVAAARTVLGRLVYSCNPNTQVTNFPQPSELLALPLADLPMPGKRRETLRRVCTLFVQSATDPEIEAIAGLAGIGPWTVDLVGLRGLGQPDRFPEKDLGLIRAWHNLVQDETPLVAAQQDWRPWRSYAANLLWKSLSA